MSAKEQGNKLTTQFYNLRAWDVMEVSERKIAYEIAKKSATICIEQIIEVLGGAGVDGWADPDIYKYWQEVLNHIKNS